MTSVRKGSDSDEEDAEPDRPSRGGVAIAPPPVLQDASSLDVAPKSSGGPSGASVAAKIMAKYGFKVCRLLTPCYFAMCV